MIYNYFQLLTNCTLIKLSLPVQGKYLFYIELSEKNNYEDTFILELTSNFNENLLFTVIQSQWMIIIPIILGILLILIIILCAMMIIRKRQYNQILHNKQVCFFIEIFSLFIYLLFFIEIIITIKQ
jgi:hypothetical protein